VATTTAVTKDAWITALGQCESHNRPYKKVLDSNHKYSYGLVQFQMATWLSFGKEFGATRKNIFKPDLQRQVAQSMLNQGLSYHWSTCAGIVTSELGDYPVQNL